MKTVLIAAALALALSGCSPEIPTAEKDYGSPVVKVMVGRGHGSGVYLGSGLILTAAHVVDSAKKDEAITIKTESGNLLKNAEVLWSSKARDVALIRVSSTAGLSPAVLSCDMPKVGDAVQARGNPLSIEFFSAWGHVAGTARKIGPWLVGLPTDMTILPGMSGGPVFGADGRVVGLSVGVLMAPAGFGGVSFTGATLIVPGAVICPLLGRA